MFQGVLTWQDFMHLTAVSRKRELLVDNLIEVQVPLRTSHNHSRTEAPAASFVLSKD